MKAADVGLLSDDCAPRFSDEKLLDEEDEEDEDDESSMIEGRN